MTLDTSAVLAVLQNEPEREEFVTLIAEAPHRVMSTVSLLEAAMVLEGRRGESAGADLDLFLQLAGVEIVAFEGEQLAIARAAFRRFGRGRHPAGLNFGDCAAYALAVWSGEPMLFKGTDFSATDVERVATKSLNGEGDIALGEDASDVDGEGDGGSGGGG